MSRNVLGPFPIIMLEVEVLLLSLPVSQQAQRFRILFKVTQPASTISKAGLFPLLCTPRSGQLTDKHTVEILIPQNSPANPQLFLPRPDKAE